MNPAGPHARKPSPSPRRRIWRRVVVLVLALLTVVITAAVITIRRQLPPGVMKDIQAGVAAVHIRDPDARLQQYLENRYGPMSDAANRQQAFLDFFNADHIEALQLMVRHAPDSQREANIRAMGRWVKGYRESLTPLERATLGAHFQTPDGRLSLQRARAFYNSQDVHYRGQTAVVISELLKTINVVQQP